MLGDSKPETHCRNDLLLVVSDRTRSRSPGPLVRTRPRTREPLNALRFQAPSGPRGPDYSHCSPDSEFCRNHLPFEVRLAAETSRAIGNRSQVGCAARHFLSDFVGRGTLCDEPLACEKFLRRKESALPVGIDRRYDPRPCDGPVEVPSDSSAPISSCPMLCRISAMRSSAGFAMPRKCSIRSVR